MRALSVFSGAGGLDLSAEAAGIEVVGQCEIDKYCNKVLEYWWPGVPRFKDIKTVTAKSLEEKGVMRGGIDLVFGGFP